MGHAQRWRLAGSGGGPLNPVRRGEPEKGAHPATADSDLLPIDFACARLVTADELGLLGAGSGSGFPEPAHLGENRGTGSSNYLSRQGPAQISFREKQCSSASVAQGYLRSSCRP